MSKIRIAILLTIVMVVLYKSQKRLYMMNNVKSIMRHHIISKRNIRRINSRFVLFADQNKSIPAPYDIVKKDLNAKAKRTFESIIVERTVISR